MPNGKRDDVQNQGRRSGEPQNQGQAGAKGQGQPGGQAQNAPHNRLEDVTNRIQDAYESARGTVAEGYRNAEDVVSNYPAPSVLVGFGLGFGLGLVLCSILAKPEPTWAERYLPESLQDLPDNVQRFAHHLPSNLRSQLPRAVSRRI